MPIRQTYANPGCWIGCLGYALPRPCGRIVQPSQCGRPTLDGGQTLHRIRLKIPGSVPIPVHLQSAWPTATGSFRQRQFGLHGPHALQVFKPTNHGPTFTNPAPCHAHLNRAVARAGARQQPLAGSRPLPQRIRLDTRHPRRLPFAVLRQAWPITSKHRLQRTAAPPSRMRLHPTGRRPAPACCPRESHVAVSGRCAARPPGPGYR